MVLVPTNTGPAGRFPFPSYDGTRYPGAQFRPGGVAYKGAVSAGDYTPLVPYSLTFDVPGELFQFTVPAGVTEMSFVGTGAAGGNGSQIGGNVDALHGIGGLGGLLSGVFAVNEGDLISGYVGMAGGNGYDTPDTLLGGTPGGAGPQLNIFLHEYEGLGGGGGGATILFINSAVAFVIGGGGGGAAGNTNGSVKGGDGGIGGGSTAGSGGDGDYGGFTPDVRGFGADGGTQIAGGAGGINSNQAGVGAGVPGLDGQFIGGGTTYRAQPYGSGLAAGPTGGGGGGGYYGGGGGGLGSVNALAPGAGGGGGGGSSHASGVVDVVDDTAGGNPLPDGLLLISYMGPDLP